jgi:protein-tyrosine-phosphatase
MPTPLFLCYANCCRSVLADYLYRHRFPDDTALSLSVP